MNRPGRVTAAAVVAAVGSGLAVACGLVVLAGALVGGGSVGAARPAILGAALIMVVAGAWGLSTAVGVLQLKRAARASMLIFAAVLTFLGVSGTIVLSSSSIPSPPGFTAEEFAAVRGLVAFFYIVFAVVGVWWLVLFSSRSVRAIFSGESLPERVPQPFGESAPWGRDRRQPARRRPVSITCIAAYMLLGAVSAAGMILLHAPIWMLGHQFTGWSADLVYLAMFGAQGYLGIELLHLKPLGRILSICFFQIGFINSVLFLFLPGREERAQAMLQSLPQAMQAGASGSANAGPWFLPLLFSALFTLIPVWFLIASKNAFEPEAAAPES